MAQIYGGDIPDAPDDVTIGQFILDTPHPTRPPWSHVVRPCLVDEETGRQIGSDELRVRIYGLSNALKICWNLARNDVVCLFSPNHVDYVVAMWAIQNIGAIITTANPAYTVEDLSYQLRLSRSRLLIVHSSVLSIAVGAARAVSMPQENIIILDSASGIRSVDLPTVPDLVKPGLDRPQEFEELRISKGESKKQLALLSFSSGTTGNPKAVMISHYSLVVNVVQQAQYLQLGDLYTPSEGKLVRSGSVVYGVLPFYHMYGMHLVLFAFLYFGATVVISPKFSLERMLQSIQQYRITHIYAVPPQAVLITKSTIVNNYDLSSLYFFMCGAAPMSKELTEQLVRALPDRCYIGQGYGLTESVTIVAYLQKHKRVGTLGSAGILVSGVSVRIVKSDGTLAGFNELGELQLKSPSLCLGYLDNPTANEETFVDGWMRTGDEGMVNEDNEVFITDRLKELIKVRDFQVPPAELEGHLLDHPAVADVCVVGIPDEFSGELPYAFVVPTSAAQRIIAQSGAAAGDRIIDEIVKYVAEHKASYKKLAGAAFVESVPKTSSGKILRRVLRDQAKKLLAAGRLRLHVASKLTPKL